MNPIERYSSLTNDILESSGSKLAFFKGSLQPEVLILGEAPGPLENIKGVPFVGDCGRELDSLLNSSGLSAFQLAFLNSVFRMPVGNDGRFRKPTEQEIDAYRSMVMEIIEFLSPKFILACGNVACYSLLERQGITRIRGEWDSVVMPTFHPGYTLRNVQERELVISDMRKVVEACNQHSQ
ncbi:TPA: uracil-DNA glycosylase [Photobacterium damselae]